MTEEVIMRKWRIAGINFDHMHMGDLLRMAYEHGNAEVVAICDRDHARMQTAAQNFGLGSESIFSDVDRCIEQSRPDLVILCPTTADHASAVEQVAGHGVDIVIEKPFAANLGDADRMIAATA